jgi:acyl-[acyl carrier protein]--UDP-N-acetylglucosamine O-acyltransferase
MSYIHPTAIIYPNVKIGKDVYIGAYCIIGMNSTVTKKTVMEANNCYIGNPAKWLRQNIR